MTSEPRREPVATWSHLSDRSPAHALVEGVDLVLVRLDDPVSALYGEG
jgi:methylamine---glutamate N-methyltransferase subunit C